MIRHTFSLLGGIGEKTEKHLWRKGVLTWDDFLAQGSIEGINADRKTGYDSQISTAISALDCGDSRYFARTVKRREHWRLFDAFRDGALCLDIETNGLPAGAGGYATVVGFYDGYDWQSFVRGENLTVENLNRAVGGHRCLVTFYGAVFDVPFLLRTMPGVRFDLPHFDLCFAAKRVGMEGGLKRLETALGLPRDEAVRGMSGYDAVLLWREAEQGSEEARRLLLTYNREDTRHLITIGDILYDRMRLLTGFDACREAWRNGAAA